MLVFFTSGTSGNVRAFRTSTFAAGSTPGMRMGCLPGPKTAGRTQQAVLHADDGVHPGKESQDSRSPQSFGGGACILEDSVAGLMRLAACIHISRTF